ncbi:hypothetical protein IGI49_002469 [Enterococcus sp. AZ071]
MLIDDLLRYVSENRKNNLCLFLMSIYPEEIIIFRYNLYFFVLIKKNRTKLENYCMKKR